MKRLIFGTGTFLLLVIILLWWEGSNKLLEITLTSPHNTAMYNKINVKLEKEAPVYVDYWEKVSRKKFRTCVSSAKINHEIDLILLKADTEYEYQIVIDNILPHKSEVMEFKTREQSPWLKNHRVTERHPHNPDALGDDGYILICFGRLPGNMMIIDKYGEVRWYWQVNDIGVRAASLTPRGTILAMLRPFVKDVIDDVPMTPEQIQKEEHKKPMKRGSIGFAGGTGIAEVSLTGDVLWRIDLNKIQKENEFKVIHHDVLMDEHNNIYTLYRPKKVSEYRDEKGTLCKDTLGGDGILVLDTLGNVLKTWSAWDIWNIKEDPFIARYKYDRFHMNAVSFDRDGNYLVSVPIEDQIWKINKSTGKLMWKFGRNGDFKMDADSYFSFQHAPYINSKGDLMLFNNGLHEMQSGALSYKLDEKNKTAETTLNVKLPKEKYTSRMGNAFLMPNGNLLQCSSKTGTILITNQKGEILWQCSLANAPYRALYVPKDVFKNYFTEVD